MRRALAAAMVALALLARPVGAQVSEERALLDLTVKVAPGEDVGLCTPIESSGIVRVSLQTTDGRDSHPLGPPKFMLAPYRTSPAGADAPPEIWDLPVTAAKLSTELPVVQRLYCFNLHLPTTREIAGLPSAELRTHFRYVAISLVFVPD